MKGRCLALIVLAMMPSVVSADDNWSRPASEVWGPYAPLSSEILPPAAFWDMDRLSSDSGQTLGLFAAGVDNEGTQLGPRVLVPPLSRDIDLQRDLRRLGHVGDRSGVSADDLWSRPFREGKGYGPAFSPETPRPAEQSVREVTYGFAGDDLPAVELASVDQVLDAAYEDADDGPVLDENGSAFEPSRPITGTEMPTWTEGRWGSRRDMAARLGWWVVDFEGSPTMVGQYQGLESSAFWDIDWLSSDGVQTFDLIATGLDNESTQVSLSLFRPWLSMDLDFQRFLHRLDHVPLTNMGEINSTEEIIGEDLDVGEDYAVRIQDLKYELKGQLTENIKARVNFRLLRKFGERQANTIQHCADPGGGTNRTCHVLSGQQRIDWLTVKVEPVVEAKFGPVRAEYSRPMRFFSQDDQLLTANFGDFHIYDLGEETYAFVPDGFSQVDRLRLAVDLGASTDFYASSHVRDTLNKFRETHRTSYGFDLRLTNRSWDGVKLTAYATLNDQTNQDVPFFFPEEETALGVKTALVPPYGIRHPIDYFRRTVGADVNWHPFRGYSALRRLAFTAGIEQGRIEREYASYVVQKPDDPPGPVVDQDLTDYFSGHAGTSLWCSPALETFVRYKLRATKDPLFAVNRYTGYTSTSLPDQEDLVEIGATWIPADNFLASATLGLEIRSHGSDIATFDEDGQPITCTLWYAPTPEWSLSAGYGHYTNWINQDISFPSDDPLNQTGDVRRWNYGGWGQVASFGIGHAWSDTLLVLAGIEFVKSRNSFDPLEPWPDLPFYSDAIVDRLRVTAGVDWLAYGEISTYFRYLFEDYRDWSANYNSGTAHMFLTGFSATY